MNEISTQLRAVAAYIKSHGFTPQLGPEHGCRCFVGALDSTGEGLNAYTGSHPVRLALTNVLGVREFGPLDLENAGWTKEHPEDAVAACLIAADIAECEESKA